MISEVNVTIFYYIGKAPDGGFNNAYNPVGRIVNTKESEDYYAWLVYISLETRKQDGLVKKSACTGSIISSKSM